MGWCTRTLNGWMRKKYCRPFSHVKYLECSFLPDIHSWSEKFGQIGTRSHTTMLISLLNPVESYIHSRPVPPLKFRQRHQVCENSTITYTRCINGWDPPNLIAFLFCWFPSIFTSLDWNSASRFRFIFLENYLIWSSIGGWDPANFDCFPFLLTCFYFFFTRLDLSG